MSFLWSTSHCQRLTKDRHFIYAAQYGSYGSYGHLILNSEFLLLVLSHFRILSTPSKLRIFTVGTSPGPWVVPTESLTIPGAPLTKALLRTGSAAIVLSVAWWDPAWNWYMINLSQHCCFPEQFYPFS